MNTITTVGQYQKLLGLEYKSLEAVLQNAYTTARTLRHRGGGRVFKEDDETALRLVKSLNIPAPEYDAFKDELKAAAPGVNIAYRYLSSKIACIVRQDDMYLARHADGMESILIPRQAAWDIEQYIGRTFHRKIKSELYSGARDAHFDICPPDKLRIAPVNVERNARSPHYNGTRVEMGNLGDFKDSLAERGEKPPVKMSAMFAASRHARLNPEYENKTTAQVIIGRLRNILTTKEGSFTYNGKALNRRDFYLTLGNDVWVGGGSREALEVYFSGLEHIEQPKAHFVQGGLPGTGKRR